MDYNFFFVVHYKHRGFLGRGKLENLRQLKLNLKLDYFNTEISNLNRSLGHVFPECTDALKFAFEYKIYIICDNLYYTNFGQIRSVIKE